MQICQIDTFYGEPGFMHYGEWNMYLIIIILSTHFIVEELHVSKCTIVYFPAVCDMESNFKYHSNKFIVQHTNICNIDLLILYRTRVMILDEYVVIKL